jgi:hypothetical protein
VLSVSVLETTSDSRRLADINESSKITGYNRLMFESYDVNADQPCPVLFFSFNDGHSHGYRWTVIIECRVGCSTPKRKKKADDAFAKNRRPRLQETKNKTF